jgi:type IV pilus assembly protein PilM
MASSSRILVLNLGMQTVGMAEFRPTGNGGMVLASYKLTEILADPGAESSRAGQIGIAIREMLGSFGAKGARAMTVIPAHSVFTRFVKLPKVGEEKVDQLIQYEAQQNVPFPINEVVWDYQIVGGQETENLEVVLVAIKSDVIEPLVEAVEHSGLHAGVIDVGPMALYNAFRYNYSDMGGCSLLIDIGARTTNLIFVEAGKVFSRSIPVGGSTITQAIAKDFEEGFMEAEDRKRRDGFIALGGSYADPEDPAKARVSKVIRNSMTRLHQEIARSISFYRSQQKGDHPARVFLCGGSVSLPYTREFFAEKLAMPIEFFNPLRNVAVGQGVVPEEASKAAHVLGELVGAGLRAACACPMELNLQPPSLQRAQTASKKVPFLAMAAAGLVLGAAGWWLYFDRMANVVQGSLERVRPEVQTLSETKAQFERLDQGMAAMKTAAQPLLSAVADRDYWVRILDDLHSRMPEDYIWITRLEDGKWVGDKFVTETGRPEPAASSGASGGGAAAGRPGAPAAPQVARGIRVRGLYLDNERQAGVVDDFVKKLQESPNVAEVKVEARTNPDAQFWAVEYALAIRFKEQEVKR